MIDMKGTDYTIHNYLRRRQFDRSQHFKNRQILLFHFQHLRIINNLTIYHS
jgi:hypothetical protein